VTFVLPFSEPPPLSVHCDFLTVFPECRSISRVVCRLEATLRPPVTPTSAPSIPVTSEVFSSPAFHLKEVPRFSVTGLFPGVFSGLLFPAFFAFAVPPKAQDIPAIQRVKCFFLPKL